jgi:hypothetical protein
MSSLDLSAAFDVVNFKLLMKSLKIVGLPSDIMNQIQVDYHKSQRKCFVNINGKCSMYLESDTIQGSILDPFLYSIHVSPMLDIIKLSYVSDA